MNKLTLGLLYGIIFTLASCSANFSGEVNPDLIFRQSVAGGYLVACYNTGGDSYSKIEAIILEGDESDGTFTVTQNFYNLEGCSEASLYFSESYTATLTSGAVTTERDQSRTKSVTIDGVTYEATKINLGVGLRTRIVYDEEGSETQSLNEQEDYYAYMIRLDDNSILFSAPIPDYIDPNSRAPFYEGETPNYVHMLKVTAI